MIVNLPIKVGVEANVASAAAALTNGEEQLLFTREGKIHLTKGDGTFITIVSGLSESDVNTIIASNTIITTLQSNVSDLLSRVSELETKVQQLGGY